MCNFYSKKLQKNFRNKLKFHNYQKFYNQFLNPFEI